jgi:hypothetical protein
MLYCPIYLFPGGQPEGKQLLGEIFVVNDATGDESTAHYDASLMEVPKPGRTSRSLWRKGHVHKFPKQRLGPYDLVYRALRAAVLDRNPDDPIHPEPAQP